MQLKLKIMPAKIRGNYQKTSYCAINSKTTRLVIDLYTLNETKVFSTNLGGEHKIIIDIVGNGDSPQLNAILDEIKQIRIN